MSARNKMLMVWVPVDPQRVVDKLRTYGRGSLRYIEEMEKDLAQQGYAFDAKKLAKLKKATEKYETLWFDIMDTMTTVCVGPPPGPVAPDGAAEFYQRTGKCMITEAPDEKVTTTTRSRH